MYEYPAPAGVCRVLYGRLGTNSTLDTAPSSSRSEPQSESWSPSIPALAPLLSADNQIPADRHASHTNSGFVVIIPSPSCDEVGTQVPSASQTTQSGLGTSTYQSKKRGIAPPATNGNLNTENLKRKQNQQDDFDRSTNGTANQPPTKDELDCGIETECVWIDIAMI